MDGFVCTNIIASEWRITYVALDVAVVAVVAALFVTLRNDLSLLNAFNDA